MDALTVARGYFDAWNRREPAAIAAAFAPDGTYSDPTSGGPLRGEAIARYAAGLFAAYPDLTFEVTSAGLAGEGLVAAQWVMRGTNTGAVPDRPPTGRAVSLPGADFIRVADGRIQSVEGYFDREALYVQLGLQVMVRPYAIGPVVFGACTHLDTGGARVPGAFSLTSVRVRSAAEAEEVVARSREVMSELPRLPGFISLLAAQAGTTLFTVTAWESPEAVAALQQLPAHRAAVARFFGPDFGMGGQINTLVPAHAGRRFVRCRECGAMASLDRDTDHCTCGAALPEPPPYW